MPVSPILPMQYRSIYESPKKTCSICRYFPPGPFRRYESNIHLLPAGQLAKCFGSSCNRNSRESGFREQGSDPIQDKLLWARLLSSLFVWCSCGIGGSEGLSFGGAFSGVDGVLRACCVCRQTRALRMTVSKGGGLCCAEMGEMVLLRDPMIVAPSAHSCVPLR